MRKLAVPWIVLVVGLVAFTPAVASGRQASGPGVISTATACLAATGGPGVPPPASGFQFVAPAPAQPLAAKVLLDPHDSLAAWVDDFMRLGIAKSLLASVEPGRGAIQVTIALAGAEAGSDGQIRMSVTIPETLAFPEPPKVSLFTLAATRRAIDTEYGYRCRLAHASLAAAHAAADRAARGVFRLKFPREQAPSQLAAGLALAAAELPSRGVTPRIILVSDLRGTTGTAVHLPFHFPPHTQVVLVVDLAAGLVPEEPLVAAWRTQLSAAGAARITVLYPNETTYLTQLLGL